MLLDICADTIMIYYVFRCILYYETRPMRSYLFPIVFAEIFFIILCYFETDKSFLGLYSLVAPILINIALTKSPLFVKILSGFLSSALIGSLEGLLRQALEILTHIIHFNIRDEIIRIIVVIAITPIWLLIVSKVYNRYISRSRNVQLRFLIFLAVISTFNMTDYILLVACIYNSDLSSYANEKRAKWLLFFTGLIFIAEILYIIILYFGKIHVSIMMDLTNEYIQIEKAHFRELQEKDEQTRRFRHDMNNHLISIESFALNQEYDRLVEYIRRIRQEFTKTTALYHTGNIVADGILTQKNELMKKNQIEFKTDISFHKKCYIDDFSLCLILSNTLQNAIEACIRYPEPDMKQINLKLHCDETFLLLVVRNPVKEPVIIKNNRIKTTKKDKLNHGFGLQQIERIVKDYQGTLVLQSENNCFEIIIRLNNIKEVDDDANRNL